MARVRGLQKKARMAVLAGFAAAFGLSPDPVWQNDIVRRIFLHH